MIIRTVNRITGIPMQLTACASGKRLCYRASTIDGGDRCHCSDNANGVYIPNWLYVAWLSIQYQAFTYSTASGTYGFSRVRMIFRFITIRATEPCLSLEYSGFRSRETNSPYNLIGGARRRLSSRDRVQPPLVLY